MREFNSEDVIGYVSFYIDKEESDINISYLSVNENIEGFAIECVTGVSRMSRLYICCGITVERECEAAASRIAPGAHRAP